ncbi:hypothetical protein [Pedobacter alpinus]|uniref:Lipoprotein n=1 Tax=Pedobacter alpinus TaxID=1590643 RepID=A0ABW5TVV8_9SPHI
MKTLKKIILASIILLLTISCKKDDLLKATQSGSNNMVAKINGKVWQRKGCFGCLGGGSGISVVYNSNGLSIVAEQNDESQNITINLLLLNISANAKVQLRDSNGNPSTNSVAKIQDYQSNKFYVTTENNIGTVTITKFDPNKKIIAGIFELKAENENSPNDVINITDGWFDIKYN